MFAGRERDWLDVRTILIRQGTKLDFMLIQKELKPLLELKEDTEAMLRFEKLYKELAS